MTEKQRFIQEHAPCYLYDEAQIAARCRELQAAIPQARFLYSVKANPFAPVVKLIQNQGFGADAASANEVLWAEQAGMTPEMIYYSAPGKTERDIEKTFQKCTVIADSLYELQRLEDCCAAKQLKLRVGLRINPGFSMDGPEGMPGKFGVDEALLRPSALCFEHIEITGIHIHLQSQVLDTDKLCRYYENCFALAERVNGLLGRELSFINFGSGIGTVYDAAAEKPLMTEKIGQTLQKLRQRGGFGSRVKFILETGRFVVCSAGTYYTRIADKKISGGKTYLIVQNGMNGFLRPAIAELLRQNAGAFPARGQEPLYTSGTQCAFSVPGRQGPEERVDVVGNLCTALDVLARNILLPCAEPGDILAVTNAGSYGYTLSPQLFSSLETPGQFMWTE